MKVRIAKGIEVFILIMLVYGAAFAGDSVTGRDVFIWTVGLLGGWLTRKYIEIN